MATAILMMLYMKKKRASIFPQLRIPSNICNPRYVHTVIFPNVVILIFEDNVTYRTIPDIAKKLTIVP